MKKNVLPCSSVLLVCSGGACREKRAKKLRSCLKKAAKERGLDVLVAETSCLRACGDGPHVAVSPKGPIFSRVKPNDAPDIIDRIASKHKK